jgi:hypothetical protein
MGLDQPQHEVAEHEYEYEFRFLAEGMSRAVHIVRLNSDHEACLRAYAYLEASPEFDSVVIRCGVRFMRKIECEPIWKTPPADMVC